MYYEFYIDQFFLEQFFCGFLLLLAAGKLSRASPSCFRLVLGSLAGAAWMSVLICLGWPGLYPVCFCAAAAFTFWRRPLRKEWRGNLSATLCLLAVTVFFGGALEAITALLPLPLTAAFFAAYAAISVLSAFLQKKIRVAENTAMVQISLENRNLALEGLLDTGNLLTEPMTGHPVSIAEEQAVAPLLGDGWEERQGFCLIPYHSLGTDSGWLRGVTFDEMTVTMRRGSRVIRRPVIALYEGKVSAGNGYRVIVHPEHAP
ncbi:MAG: sigma-E processing peptidase SpoIIGA [Lachnospiraceae bacterium]|nr:sigma-E processing peptidase SpoIIGA [Lachnospiraceae bacterium]